MNIRVCLIVRNVVLHRLFGCKCQCVSIVRYQRSLVSKIYCCGSIIILPHEAYVECMTWGKIRVISSIILMLLVSVKYQDILRQ